MVGGKRSYPSRPEDYELYEIVGEGGSAAVHRARCVPFDEIVAVKILDFERSNNDLSKVYQEAKTMVLIDHPNVLRAHCAFVSGHNLWVVMPYMAGGSFFHIMKLAYTNGFKDEVIIATVLRDTLKALEYLHQQGYIHRDVKAGNILIDGRSGVKLGDFGVSASLYDDGDRKRARNTFVGTPCWMAPEVMLLENYDFKADIWSFGITALELAHGHAPFSSSPPNKVLLMTLQHAPPCLENKRDKKFSKSFKHMIAMCLVKDPSKRPTATKLLKQNFFKQARSADYISRKILEGLPSLGDRYKTLKLKEEELLAQKKMLDGEKEELSQSEYKRGISAWDFDMEDIKFQASMIQEGEDGIPVKDLEEGYPSSSGELDTLHESNEAISHCMNVMQNSSLIDDNGMSSNLLMEKRDGQYRVSSQTGMFQGTGPDFSEIENVISSSRNEDHLVNGPRGDGIESCLSSISATNVVKHRNTSPPRLCPEQKFSRSSSIPPSSKGQSVCRSESHSHLQNLACNGGISHASHGTNEQSCKTFKPPVAEDPDEKSKTPIVQQRGRFKVTSESVDLDKVPTVPGIPKGHSFQEYIHCLMNKIQTDDSSGIHPVETVPSLPTILADKSLLEAAHQREKELIETIADLHTRLNSTRDELKRIKARDVHG